MGSGYKYANETTMDSQLDNVKRTRIYKAMNPTLILDDMVMPMSPLGADDANGDLNFTERGARDQGGATGTENPTTA